MTSKHFTPGERSIVILALRDVLTKYGYDKGFATPAQVKNAKNAIAKLEAKPEQD